MVGGLEVEEDNMGTEELDAAREMGLMIIKQDVTNAEVKECDTLVDFVFVNNGDDFANCESINIKNESPGVSKH